MNELEKELLKAGAKAFVLATDFCAKHGASYDAVMSTLSRLQADGFAELKREEKSFLKLTPEGEENATNGSPEYRLASATKSLGGTAILGTAANKAGLTQQGIAIALRWGIQKKLFSLAKDGHNNLVQTPAGIGVDEVKALLSHVAIGGSPTPEEAKFLLSRKLVEEKTEKTISFKATAAGRTGGSKQSAIAQVTPQLLKSGSWKEASFKPYDLSTVIAPLRVARKHAYKEFLQRIKEHLVGMGFVEAHGPLVELEFWDMDALYMPQDHPAREIHDVFKLSGKGTVEDKKLVSRVKQAHEQGLANSRGWRYEWNPAVAMQLVLRSQTTAVSARHLACGIKPPAKLFSIGRVFRPDEIDWKHFIEFNQCEGIVVDEGMTFRELLGYLQTFAKEVFGAKESKFIPHYYPFTEPSVDLAVKIEGRGWTEVGGAGMFRPEMLAALGVECPVLAWGLGIDRLAMLSLGIDDVRNLFSTDLEFLSSR